MESRKALVDDAIRFRSPRRVPIWFVNCDQAEGDVMMYHLSLGAEGDGSSNNWDWSENEWGYRLEIAARRHPAPHRLTQPALVEVRRFDVHRAVTVIEVQPELLAAVDPEIADLIEKNFDELSQLDTLDMGAPISRTRSYKLRVLGMLRYYAGQTTAIHGETIENSLPGEIFSYTLKEPVGVVGAITPWNFPIAIPSWKLIPAPHPEVKVGVFPMHDFIEADTLLTQPVIQEIEGECGARMRVVQTLQDLDSVSLTQWRRG